MATNSPLQGVPLPEVTDADNVPYDLGNAVNFIEGRLAMRFSSAADRDAKVKTPAHGMLAYLQDVKLWTTYNGSTWQTVADPAMFTAWTPYTPTTPGNAFTAGNGAITGRYKVVGKTCYFAMSVTWGSTSSWAAGSWLINLPLSAASGDNTFPATLMDASAATTANRYSGVAVCDNTARIGISFGNASGYMTSTTPIAIAAGDKLAISGSYEIA